MARYWVQRSTNAGKTWSDWIGCEDKHIAEDYFKAYARDHANTGWRVVIRKDTVIRETPNAISKKD